jgi:predicted nucleic acid-binding protein
MKVLDTPVLLDLLRGSAPAKAFVRALGPEEAATTEIALFELNRLAHQDASSGLERRLAALGRLRRRLVVLPFDAASQEAAGRMPPSAMAPLTQLAVGCALGHGGTEFVTTSTLALPRAIAGLKLTHFDKMRPKKW